MGCSGYLKDVARTDFSRQRLFRALAESLVVDEGAVAALRVLEVELARFVPDERMVTR